LVKNFGKLRKYIPKFLFKVKIEILEGAGGGREKFIVLAIYPGLS
jgi:hypothetical protein